MNKDIVYSFQESIEAVDKGRGRCLFHDDYWINIILPGRVPLLMSPVVYSFHLAKTREFLELMVKALDARITNVFHYFICIYLAKKMKYHLNYSKEDLNYIVGENI
ncbi:MAG: hypothetical protein PWQ15_528 [Methanobacterium sp.]|nr:hypothetical protein [Methanobacterium sp.]